MTDIFLWANKTDSMKQGLQVELFLFNKNYTPYSIRLVDALQHVIKPTFLYHLINEVTLGAGTGLKLIDLEKAEGTRNSLSHTPLEKVGRAETLLHLLENERQDIVEFSQSEHEFKRIRGVVARYTHPSDKDVRFYVIKLLKASDAVWGDTAAQITDGQLEPHSTDVSVRLPVDNQVLIVDGEIFIFNQSKFTQLFNYDVQEIQRSDEIGAAISKQFKLSLPNLFNDFAVMAREKKSTLKKLLEVNTSNLMSQDAVITVADEMAIELMTDDDGAIILYDSKDLSTFLDIINDNYLSSMAGMHYLAKSKKPLEVTEE